LEKTENRNKRPKEDWKNEASKKYQTSKNPEKFQKTLKQTIHQTLISIDLFFPFKKL
jgi:hypothetical protein